MLAKPGQVSYTRPTLQASTAARWRHPEGSDVASASGAPPEKPEVPLWEGELRWDGDGGTWLISAAAVWSPASLATQVAMRSVSARHMEWRAGLQNKARRVNLSSAHLGRVGSFGPRGVRSARASRSFGRSSLQSAQSAACWWTVVAASCKLTHKVADDLVFCLQNLAQLAYAALSLQDKLVSQLPRF